MSKFQDSLKKYLDIFRGQETYFVNDVRNLEYFKANPANTKREEIHQKLSVMDDADFNAMNALEPMTQHILQLNIDPRLAMGDLSVVEDIAKITINGKQENLLHMASVYCNLHRPDAFPIYSDQHLEFYKRYIKEYQLKLNPEELSRYSVFTAALNDLITRYGIKGKLNYIEIRKFGWVYAEKILQEADPLVTENSR